MGLKLDWVANDKILFSDNILVYRTKDICHFFRIYITDRAASIGRYWVPGRIDIYNFDWIPGTVGLGNRVAYFTDTHLPLNKAMKQLVRDLKKKQVKQLFKEAKIKCPRSYLDYLLEALR